MKAKLYLNGWAGRRETDVYIVGETAKRYRVTPVKNPLVLPGPRIINVGETALVPKQSVKITDTQEAGE